MTPFIRQLQIFGGDRDKYDDDKNIGVTLSVGRT